MPACWLHAPRGHGSLPGLIVVEDGTFDGWPSLCFTTTMDKQHVYGHAMANTEPGADIQQFEINAIIY
jgi:hypothetical protein